MPQFLCIMTRKVHSGNIKFSIEEGHEKDCQTASHPFLSLIFPFFQEHVPFFSVQKKRDNQSTSNTPQKSLFWYSLRNNVRLLLDTLWCFKKKITKNPAYWCSKRRTLINLYRFLTASNAQRSKKNLCCSSSTCKESENDAHMPKVSKYVNSKLLDEVKATLKSEQNRHD